MEDCDGEDILEAPELPLEVRQYPISVHLNNKKKNKPVKLASCQPIITTVKKRENIV